MINTTRLLRYYLYKSLHLLTLPLLAALYWYFWDDIIVLDRIYNAALMLSCILCFRDREVMGALVILILYWLGAELLFALPNNDISRGATYLFCLLVVWRYFAHALSKLTAVMLAWSLYAEWYWRITHYAHSPNIFYYVGMLGFSVLALHLLRNRIVYYARWFNIVSAKVVLDWQIAPLLQAYFALLVCTLVEYFLRHLYHYDSLIVYTLYRPVAQVISAMTLGLIYLYYFNEQAKKSLKA